MSATTLASCAFRSGRTVALGEDPHRHVVFPDAVDPAGQMEFGAEGGLEKPFDDLGVGEGLLFGALARGDGGDFGAGRRQPGGAFKADRSQADRDDP